jgi:multidrug efflux pump subunit AcrA (membrane-fusion protein)
MTPHLIARLAPLAVLAVMPACSSPPAEQAGALASKADAAPGLVIESVAAREIDKVPLGSVPGTISLPPAARVAVTAPFAGAVVRVYVIAGEPVVRGQALGLVRATEPVQIGGDLARARRQGLQKRVPSGSNSSPRKASSPPLAPTRPRPRPSRRAPAWRSLRAWPRWAGSRKMAR